MQRYFRHICDDFEFEFIGVLRHMQRYFSHIHVCDDMTEISLHVTNKLKLSLS